MTDDETRAAIAAALGWVWWLELRGGYEFIIPQLPGEQPPWFKEHYSNRERAALRYTPFSWADYDPKKHIDQYAFRDTDWLHSLDACARDLLPVARERGWYVRLETEAPAEMETGLPQEAAWFYGDGGRRPTLVSHAPTGEIARALCEAWLAGPGKAVAG